MKATEIAEKLAADAEHVAQYLLPSGKRNGVEWVCGSIGGEAGKSLKVRITGGKAGVWRDFADESGGDLIGLWMATKGVSLHEACEEAKQYLGIVERADRWQDTARYATPSREGVTPLHDLPLRWLKTDRKLSNASIKAYKLAVKDNAVMFPYLREGRLIAAKYRTWDAKKFWTDADCRPCLFGWQAIEPDARSVAICEGELDACALYEYGIPALSVPFGGGKGAKHVWIESEFERLSVYDEIYLCLDLDDAGREATSEIIARLGRERCKVVKLSHKDANDCLIAGVAQANVQRAFADAKTVDPKELREACSYIDEVEREFASLEAGEVGLRTPWNKFGENLVLRPGEVSVWAGISGHGKSQVVGHVTARALVDEVRVCMASMEFKPAKVLRRLQCQLSARRFPSGAYSRHISTWYRDRLWMFDVTGTSKAETILEVFLYAARRYGVKVFVLDNLSKCGFDEDDYNGVKQFVDKLGDLAKAQDVHVMLVHHVRKTEAGEAKPPGKSDVKGSGGIIDMADTLVMVWRNKPKEEKKFKAEASLEELNSMPDCILSCFKQRNGDSEPKAHLWFDEASYQYLEHSAAKAKPYVGFSIIDHQGREHESP